MNSKRYSPFQYVFVVLFSCSIITTYSQTSGFILIKSNPSGAVVFINGKTTGKNTPFQMQLEAGDYKFNLQYETYHTFEGEFTINKGQTITKDVDLKPAFGSIILTSEPSGADIKLDGVKINQKTPATLENIPSGQRNITLSKDMYSNAYQLVEVKDGQSSNVFLDLLADYGTIGIVSKPEAVIHIDGSFAGTGNFAGRLSPGTHLIEVFKDNYYSTKREVKMVSGQEVVLNFQLEPIVGNFTIICEPVETEIFLDGKSMGFSPKIISGILIGEHQLLLKKDGFVDYNQLINISESSTNTIRVDLKPVIHLNLISDPTFAKIIIDNQYKGETPKILNTYSGNHIIEIEKEFYQKLKKELTIINDTTYKVRLIPLIDKVEFLTYPKNARLYIDGKNVGNTPISLDLAQGPHKLKIVKNGYSSLYDDHIFDGQTNQLSYNLEENDNHLPVGTAILLLAIGVSIFFF